MAEKFTAQDTVQDAAMTRPDDVTTAPGADGLNKAIEIKGLVKQYKKVVAVNNISLDVYEGEIFGFLGPNGAGKTTTLEMVETLQKPTSGQIMVDGFDVARDAWQVKRRIGIQLQSATFYPELTLVEQLRMFAACYDVPVDPEALLERVGLLDKKKSYPEKLSGGQRQRFSIATTLVNQPRVIFLDEPTTGLDPQARVNLWDMIREIKAAGTTVVMTTHYMEEAEELCDRLAIMDQGKIISMGSPAELIERLLASGFRKPEVRRQASLEDVFLTLTGRSLRDE